MSANSPRLLATKVIADIIRRNGSLSSRLPSAIAKVESKEKGLLQQLCYGCCRYLPSLQLTAGELLEKPASKQDEDVYALILLGIYQLAHTNVADHAAIDETVEVAEMLNKPWAKPLVNGVLRNYQRQTDALKSLANKPEYRYQHPQWLIDRCKASWPDQWESILEQNNIQAPMTLRVNLSRISRDEYLALLADAEIPAILGAYSPAAITLESATDVFLLPGFADGFVSVQDEAAQLAAGLMDLSTGQSVLDACAAPGGKTCHMLEQQSGLSNLLALDQSELRLRRVEDNLDRLLLSADVVQGDASDTSWWGGNQFDRILVDAPCSATGVIRRNPDIKYLRQNKDIKALSKLQERIVKNLWAMLKPGGRMVYATCSILPAENDTVIKRILKSCEDAQEIKITADWGIERPFGRQLFPQANGHDGFYYAVLEKSL